MDVDRIGVDESVSTLFPPERLVEALDDELSDGPAGGRNDGSAGALPDGTEEARADGAPTVVEVDGSADSLADCQAVVTFDYRESFLDLEWIHSVQAGVDRFPQEELAEAGVVLTNSTGIHGDAVGETVAGFVLALARRLHTHVADQRERTWSQPAWDEAWTVAGETACVVGLGSLGRGIVDRLDGLGLDVVGVRRTPTPEPGVSRIYPAEELDDAVADARFVVLAVPLTAATRGLVDAQTFRAMREDAYLVNVARGGVVDQSALVEALQQDRIAGAALDVFETEPLPEDSPLWSMDDVIVSPHCAAFTREYCEHVGAILRESVRRIEAGDDPVNRVV